MNDPETTRELDSKEMDNESTEAADQVREDLAGLRARAQERDKFLALLQRTQADFENYQKRNQRERESERRYWHGALALDLLPVIDNLDRAMTAAKQAGESGPLVQGVGLVQTQLLDILKRHGIPPAPDRKTTTTWTECIRTHMDMLVATAPLDEGCRPEERVASGARLWLLGGAVAWALLGDDGPDPFSSWADLVSYGIWPVGPVGGGLEPDGASFIS